MMVGYCPDYSMNIFTGFQAPSMASGMQSSSSGSLNLAQRLSLQIKGEPSMYGLPSLNFPSQ